MVIHGPELKGRGAGIIPSLSCHQSSKSSQASQPEAAFLLCRFKLEIARDTEIMCLKSDAGWGNNLLFYSFGSTDGSAARNGYIIAAKSGTLTGNYKLS